MKTIKILCSLLCAMLLAALPATAQNNDDKNKAIIETNEGSQELNTDDIQLIRFDGGKVTVVQPWGETFFDRTLRSLTFQRPNPGTLRLTATTSIGSDSSNRAQAIDGDGKLASTWAAGDVVYVYADASTTTSIGTLEPKSDDYGKSTATLSGDIDATGLTDNQTLYFSTKDRASLDLTSQDGTVESLFYFTATGTITINGANATIEDLNFSRPIAIVKFTLKDKATGNPSINATQLTVNDGTTTYTVTPTTATDVLFVGIPGISDQTVTLTATDGNEYFLYQRAGVSFTNNEYYAINVKMQASDLARPLTFEARTAGAVVTFTATTKLSPAPSIEYSTDGTTWTTYTEPITLAAVGDKVSFRGTNATYAYYFQNEDDYSHFSCSRNCFVYGNIMSLINKDNYPSNTTLTGTYTFCNLFRDNVAIYNHSTKALLLPATTLTSCCYYGMFRGCESLITAPALPAEELAFYCYFSMFRECIGLTTAPALLASTMKDYCYAYMFDQCTDLTSAPALPATNLANDCYHAMFSKCSNLTSAPALPATTLANYCYQNMFSQCTSLTTAPVLPATTLKKYCYSGMFFNCNHLTTAPELPATTLAERCYSTMFSSCTRLTTAPILPATTLAKECYYEMFYWCTSLTTAPDLPATTLDDNCYYGMFYGCTNLNSITCLATDISASSCTTNWLKNVAASGTFYKASSMESWTTGANGIPSGWTTKNYVEGALKGEFTINSGGGKVSFSQGNLQYQASTDTWRFAEHQYDMIGSDNANISDSYTGWIDLFGWGTGNNPTNSSTNSGDYSTFTDWGVNAISNGGNIADLWHTLTKDEWVYLFEHHTKRWSNVNGVNGYVIRPDGVSTAIAASYTASEWATEEAAGSVFLPAACSRGGKTFNAGSWGDYWSSTPSNSDDAYYQYFHQGGQNPSSACRWGGRSVRLVYEPPYFQGAGTEASPYLISSAADWNYLAVKVNSGTSYAGKFFRQTANIDVTTMVGNSSDSKPFSGTYDGDGNTLNLDLNTTTPHTAPFRLIVDATIKNVVTTGSVHSTNNHPSGLVGFTDGTCTIQNCRVGANVGGAQHSGGIVGHCYHANISIIGCVYSGTLTPASGQKTGGILGWGGDGGGHTMTISDCLFVGSLVGSTQFHPIGIVQNTDNTRTVSNSYYTLAANIDEDTHGNSFVKGLDYKGKFARSITAGSDVTVANAGEATVYDVSGIISYGTGILYDGVLYAGNGEEVSLTLSHTDAPSGYTFSQYTVEGGGSLDNPTSNSPTLTMADANQTIGAEWIPEGAITFNYTGVVQTFTALATGYYTLECYGAEGGYNSSGLGGKGGLSQLTYPLTKGDVLYIYVGGQGECIDGSSSHPEGGDGGWNGGGKGGTGVAWGGGNGAPYNGGGGGGGATHVATSAIGPITKSTDFTNNHTGLLLIAGGGGGGLSWGPSAGGAGGGAEGGKGHRGNDEWNIAWNNGTLSCGRDGMTSSTGGGSCEGCGGGGAGYQGGNTWTVTYNASNQSYSGAGGSSWGETTNGKGYTTTTGGATEGGNGKAVITWYGTTYPTE